MTINKEKKLSENHQKPKTFKKFLYSLSAFILLIFLFVFASWMIIKDNISTKNNANVLKYNIVLNRRFGHYDKGFSQQAVEGVCLFFEITPEDCNGSNSKFKQGLISYGYPQTISDTQLINDYLTNFIDVEGTNVFVMPGFTFNSFLCDFADKYAQKKVILLTVGTNYKLACQTSSWPTNLWEIFFEEAMAGYHAAIYAAIYALQNRDDFNDSDNNPANGKQIAFGALGGLFIPAIKNYFLGFKLGLEIINQEKEKFMTSDNHPEDSISFAQYKTIGGFGLDKSSTTKSLAKKMYKDGISVIFSIAVTLTNDMHTAALEMNTITKKTTHWVVGVDIDQGYSLYDESFKEVKKDVNKRILVSAVIKIREAVKNLIKNKIVKKITPMGTEFHSDEKFVSIPERFKKTLIWKEFINKLGDSYLLISLDKVARIKELAASGSKGKMTDQCLLDNITKEGVNIFEDDFEKSC